MPTTMTTTILLHQNGHLRACFYVVIRTILYHRATAEAIPDDVLPDDAIPDDEIRAHICHCPLPFLVPHIIQSLVVFCLFSLCSSEEEPQVLRCRMRNRIILPVLNLVPYLDRCTVLRITPIVLRWGPWYCCTPEYQKWNLEQLIGRAPKW
jgi:hypothetical protein